MNVANFLREHRKINGDDPYPPAHNSLLAGSIPAVNAVRDVIAPLASYLHSKLAEFPTSGACAFQLRSCSIDFGQRREE
jgi:hypothetical protein